MVDLLKKLLFLIVIILVASSSIRVSFFVDLVPIFFLADAFIVALKLMDREIRVYHSIWWRDSDTSHELLVLTLQHQTHVLLPTAGVDHIGDEIPLLLLEGVLDVALGVEKTLVILFIDDGEVGSVTGALVTQTFDQLPTKLEGDKINTYFIRA